MHGRKKLRPRMEPWGINRAFLQRLTVIEKCRNKTLNLTGNWISQLSQHATSCQGPFMYQDKWLFQLLLSNSYTSES